MGMENKVIHILSTGYPQTYPQSRLFCLRADRQKKAPPK
jgi:hypothetical protein